MSNFVLKKIKKEAKELQHENRFIKYAHVLDFISHRSGFNSYHELKEKFNSSSNNQKDLMKHLLTQRKNILESIETPAKKEQESEFIQKLEQRIV